MTYITFLPYNSHTSYYMRTRIMPIDNKKSYKFRDDIRIKNMRRWKKGEWDEGNKKEQRKQDRRDWP